MKNELITKIIANRPVADESLDQHLMDEASMQSQLASLGIFSGQKVFFLGDDDHMSVLLGQELQVGALVLEYDERIIESLNDMYKKLGLTSCKAVKYDAHTPIPGQYVNKVDAFYINPPYSSKTDGADIKLWLDRSVEVCPEACFGVLVMPWNGGNLEEDWVYSVQNSVEIYLAESNLEIVQVEHNAHSYESVSHPGLKSSNIHLRKK